MSRLAIIVAAGIAVGAAGVATAQMSPRPAPGVRADVLPPELEGVEVVEKLGEMVAARARFVDETGAPTELGALLDGRRPLLLTFYYSSCPMLCSVALGDLLRVLNDSPWAVGDKFRIVSISMDSTETHRQAFETRETYLDRYRAPTVSEDERFTFVEEAARALPAKAVVARWKDSVTGRLPTASVPDPRQALAEGWTFLTGDAANIRAVADSVGFNFKEIAAKNQFAHPSAIVVLSPRGRVVSYIHGLSYQPQELTSRVIAAALDEPTASTAQFIYSCFHFVEPTGTAAIAAVAMRYGGVLFVVILVAFLLRLFVISSRSRRHAGSAAS